MLTQQHSAYSAFTQGLVRRWTYLLRMVPDIGLLLHPLEEAIHQKFLPSMTDRAPCGPVEHEYCHYLLVWKVRVYLIPPRQHLLSLTPLQGSAPLIALVVAHEHCYSRDLDYEIKAECRSSKRSSQLQRLEESSDSFTPSLHLQWSYLGRKERPLGLMFC